MSQPEGASRPGTVPRGTPRKPRASRRGPRVSAGSDDVGGAGAELDAGQAPGSEASTPLTSGDDGPPGTRRPPLTDLRPLRRQLEAMPQHPRVWTKVHAWYFRTRRTIDFLGHVRFNVARVLAKAVPYPKPFRHVTFRTEDGVPIAGWLGPQHADHPSEWGLLIVPGMFASKDDGAHKARAVRVWRHWRVPVMCIDMRAFGESAGIATAGWKEALDVHGAAALMVRETGVKRVAVLAESMAGAAALNALAHDTQAKTGYLAGGVLCFSAFVDARDAVTYISTKPPKGHPFTPAWDGFRKLLRLKSGGSYERFDEFLEDVAQVNGLRNLDELLDLANPKWKVPMLGQPTLLVHAIDDPVVPVRHARRMERYADGHPHVQVLLTTWGGHTGFEPLDPWWFWEVCRRFFGTINDVPLENLARKVPNVKGTKEPHRPPPPVDAAKAPSPASDH